MTLTSVPDTFTLKEGDWSELRDSALLVRRAVFQDEQGIPRELDEDDLDSSCLHVVVEARGGAPLGTARIYDNHLQRLAVLAPARMHGLGFLLGSSLLRIAFVRGYQVVDATAQPGALGLAKILGFDVDPNVINIAGRPHHVITKVMDPR
jgi:predicted GNAT family N-acyltransferase